MPFFAPPAADRAALVFSARMQDSRSCPRWYAGVVVASVLLIALVYACVQSLLSGGIGQAVFRTGDETGYIDTLTRMHRGVASLDLRYALSGTTYAYGHLYFFVLATITALPDALGQETLFIFLMRFTNTLLFAGVAWTLASLLRRFWSRPGAGWSVPVIAWLLVCTFPCLHTVLLLVKPEMLQALLFLLALHVLWSWHDRPRPWKLAAAGSLLGLCVAAKISGVLFLATPAAYFGLRALRGERLSRSVAAFALVLASAAPAAIVATDPKLWLFASGPSDFLKEFRLYSAGLSASAVAEVDLFRPLGTRADVLSAWLTHPYTHGFVWSWALYALAGGAIVWAWRHERSRSAFPIVTLALLAQAVCVVYFLVTTTRITSWYFFPTLLLLVPLSIVAVARLLPARRGVSACLAILVLAQGASNLRHVAGVVDGVAVERAALFRRESPHFEGAASFLRGATVPLGQVFVSIDAPLDVTRDQLRFWPAAFDDPANDSPHHVGRYGTFRRYEIGTLVPERPDVVVFNNTHPQFASRFDLTGPDFRVAYEDEYATVLTRHPVARRVLAGTALSDASAWNPPGVAPEPPARTPPELILRWEKAEWKGSTREFRTPVKLPLGFVILDIELAAPSDRSQDRSLRIIFGGVHAHDPAFGKSVRTAWDAELLARVSPGRQTIRVPAAAFRRSVGEFQWSYVRTMGFGGVLSPGTEVRLHSVTFEFDVASTLGITRE